MPNDFSQKVLPGRAASSLKVSSSSFVNLCCADDLPGPTFLHFIKIPRVF